MKLDLERDSKVADLLEAWRSEPLPADATGVHDQAQLQNVQRALRRVGVQRERRARMRRLLGGLAVAAGISAVAAGGWLLGRQRLGESEQARSGAVESGPSVRLAQVEGDVRVADAAGRVLGRRAALGSGASLDADGGSFELAFPSGARVRSAGETHAQVTEPGRERREALFLARGHVQVEVPRLAQPIEFSVDTPDARVVVHGTSFSVDVDPEVAAGPLTRVAVARGLVEVQASGQSAWLRAGDHWPPEELAPVAGQVDGGTRASELPEVVPGDLGPAHGARRSERRSLRSAHSLAAENRVFAAAMARRKAGDLDGALQGIERFLQRYPDSVLVQEARVEHFRLLRRMGRTAEAAREARAYLGDYRDGYARQEARDLVLENP